MMWWEPLSEVGTFLNGLAAMLLVLASSPQSKKIHRTVFLPLTSGHMKFSQTAIRQFSVKAQRYDGR